MALGGGLFDFEGKKQAISIIRLCLINKASMLFDACTCFCLAIAQSSVVVFYIRIARFALIMRIPQLQHILFVGAAFFGEGVLIKKFFIFLNIIRITLMHCIDSLHHF